MEQKPKHTVQSAALQILKDASPELLNEREIAMRILEEGLKTTEGKTFHKTVTGALSNYLNRTSEPDRQVKRVYAATWQYIGKDKNVQTPDQLVERVRTAAEERQHHNLRHHLYSIVDLCNNNPESEPLQELNVFTQRLLQIRARQNFVQVLDLDHNEQTRNSIVFVGATGRGKSHTINCLLRLGSPLVDFNDLSGGYAWNRPVGTSTERRHLYSIAVDNVSSELSLLGLSQSDQEALLSEASNQPLVTKKEATAILKKEKQIQDLLYKRLEGGGSFGFTEWEEISDNPFLLPTATQMATSTTPFSTHIRYGELPAAILVFKTPTELVADLCSLEKYLPGRFTQEQQDCAIALCRKTRVELVIGAGNNLTLDRVYIRSKIQEQQADVAYALAVQYRIIIFPDAALRGGVERVDTPGSGDKNPICEQNIRKVMASAHQIVCLLNSSLETDKTVNDMLAESGIYERLLQDPLNHSIHLWEIVETKTGGMVSNSLEQLKKFHQRQNSSHSDEMSLLHFNRAITQAKEALAQKDADGLSPVYDSDRIRPHMQRIFPGLFLAQCMLFAQHKKKKQKVQQSELLEKMRVSGGLEMIGNLHKLSYGYELRSTDHFLDQAENLLQFLPQGLVDQLRTPLNKISSLHSKLASVCLENGTGEEIGRHLIDNGLSLFPISHGPDSDCVLQCTEVVGKKMIECQHCLHWYHFECLGLDPNLSWNNLSFYCPESKCQKFKSFAISSLAKTVHNRDSSPKRAGRRTTRVVNREISPQPPRRSSRPKVH